jgi:Skp family chaperone for outer membrane proteins
MKTLLSTLLVASSLIAVPTAAIAQQAPAAVIIVVDSDRVYRECTACRTATTQLQSRVTALQTRQTTLEGQLRPEGQSIQAAVQALAGKEPDAALRTRAQAFQTRQQAANKELTDGQQNIQSIQANVLRQIDERLRPAITQVMTARGANLAIDVDATLARSNGVDVTNDVLAALNRTLTTVSLTPLPANQRPAQQQRPQGR